MSDTDAIARKLDFIRADIEEPGSMPAARVIAGHVAALLAALDAVLKRHEPIERRKGWNLTCSYDNHHWPCPEVQDVTAELAERSNGRGADD